MAERKPLFMSTEGFAQEMATSDSITLGALTMGGNINMASSGGIVSSSAAATDGDVLVYGQGAPELQDLTISDAPTASQHAANKAYVDAQALRGGTVKEAILTEEQLATGIIRGASALVLQNNASDDDRVVLTDGTTTRTYYFGTGTGDVQVTIGATASDSQNNLRVAINADGSAIWTSANTGDLGGIASTVLMIWEDSTAGAASSIYGTNWGAGDCQIVDFTDETDYTKKTLSDIPSSAPASSNFGFRHTSSDLENGEIHNALREDVLWMWDADYSGGTGQWTEFSGVGSIVEATAASGGGTKGKVTFDTDYGLAVSSGVVSIDLYSEPGLEFNSGALKIDVVNTDHLSLSASGINVTGVPSLFKIDGTAVGATVTTANLDDICDGSNADSLHVHTASSITFNHSALGSVSEDQHHNRQHAITSADHTASGLTAGEVLTATGATTFAFQTPAENAAAKKVENTYTTATDTTANGDPVYVNGNDTVGKARADTDAKAKMLGVIRSGGGAAGSDVEVVQFGPCAGILSSATANTPYYLQATGGIGTSLPAAGNRVFCVGYALNATDLFVRLVDYGKSDA